MVENVKLVNTITQGQLELDRISTNDYILGSIVWTPIKGAHNTYKYVGQIGESIQNTLLGTRDITIIGWMVADTEVQMDVRKSFLNGFVNPSQPIDVYYNNYVIQMMPDSTVTYGEDEKENNQYFCKFKIDGVCLDPLFKDAESTNIAMSNVIGMFRFPLVISNNPTPPGGVVFGYRQQNTIANIINSGTVDTGMQLRFIARSSLKNPSLINIDTQEYIKINKQFKAGEVVDINTNVGYKSIQGTVDGVTSNYFKYRDFNSTWLQLKVGMNTFGYTADENLEGLEVDITFSDTFLEVQKCY